ncbi:MAG TPA: flagellar biosynthetic protein FliQ [Cyanobacteria bacterium UBA8530]|nr:flagellar biosynthetic protein FliQ [Cyanobacteria bacterium UBA8530]
MNQQIFLGMCQRALFVFLILGGPALFISLFVGVAISIFQAVTQINEATMTFIPKVAAILIVLVLTGPWMLNSLLDYTSEILISIPNYVR